MTNSCNSCGKCCHLFYINLSKKEYFSQKYQTIFQDYGLINNFSKAKYCGANLLAKKTDDSCIYLENNKCIIHNTRPQVCHNFFCKSRSKKFTNMIKIIKNNN